MSPVPGPRLADGFCTDSSANSAAGRGRPRAACCRALSPAGCRGRGSCDWTLVSPTPGCRDFASRPGSRWPGRLGRARCRLCSLNVTSRRAALPAVGQATWEDRCPGSAPAGHSPRTPRPHQGLERPRRAHRVGGAVPHARCVPTGSGPGAVFKGPTEGGPPAPSVTWRGPIPRRVRGQEAVLPSAWRAKARRTCCCCRAPGRPALRR